ncbi:MAG: hypothetical protein Q9215_001428 [Flavoplaca cf. flavocitrina]
MAFYVTVIVVGVSFLLLSLLYKFIIQRAYLSPLSAIPNAHFSAPFSPFWLQWKRRSGNTGTHAIFAAHNRLGPVIRLAPNELSVNSLDGLRTIYQGGFERDEWYLRFRNYGEPNLITMMDRTSHARLKRVVAGVYSKSYLQHSEDLRGVARVVVGGRLLSVIRSYAEKDTAMNVLELAKAAAMDLTSGYIFGSKVGTNFLGDVGYRRRWLQAFGVFQTQSRRERAWGEIERFCVDMCEAAEASLHEPTRGDDKATTKKDDAGYNTKPVVYEQLSQRIGSSSSDGNKSVGGLETTKTEAIASELLDHLIAGHESTGITLMYVMYELSLRQDITRRLRVELLSTLSPLSVRFPSSSTNNKRPDNDGDGSSRIDDDLPKPSAIDALPLLDAVLQETLRLWQAVPAPQPRVTPYYSSTAASLSIDGYDKIPGGVTVSSNAYTLHRNPDVFPNPEAWMPERWLEADKERRQEMKRWLWTFSSGGRMCLGSNFAIQNPEDIKIEDTDKSKRLDQEHWDLYMAWKPDDATVDLPFWAKTDGVTLQIMRQSGLQEASILPSPSPPLTPSLLPDNPTSIAPYFSTKSKL